ncbi:hypothetical protein B0T25DRAFT_278323 [Lasiosphaeria hispida]|uniref:RNA polymerase II subunit A C-terminal domain phosphatase n=1 Tax=Lasiosphaeria hispida TaxID=260671 RepID=A0AAJ0HBQ9_9PEZI|nr:hypothetical protein B0T25DRAFT_278323 [Lasiosphaeria hispida]
MSKTIRLGSRPPYPITVVKLFKKPGDVIKSQEPLMQYSFKWTKEVGDNIRKETWNEEQTTYVSWNSPADGDLKQWLIKEGEVIPRDGPCMVIKEACSHEIQFQGLCAICGKDMTEVNWAAETRDTDRAPISMVHDQTNLTVSTVQAQRTENELQRRLLESRKLSLVVDLDQTIIHACIDPTVGEWQKDPDNPNHDSVKDVKSFQLDDGGPRGAARGCWYYIKMRPGLERFLRRISELYELHVYTMGTRAYAQSVAHIVDPDQKLFGNRVISRDENGNMFSKSLQRLFPVSTNMVVIIDDRADVWPRNRPNLIKVSPYDFFKGIGDINSSFLPRRRDLLPSAAADGAAVNGNGVPPKVNKAAVTEKPSALDELASIAGADDPAITQRQVEEQERTLEKQIKDRPLQLLQEQLDKEEEEAEKATTKSEDGSDTPPSSPPHHRHQVLRDGDTELQYLEQHLTRLHKAYYDEYDRKRASHRASSNVDLSSVPDVGRMLEGLKSKALRGTKVVLTGIVPMGVEIAHVDVGQQLVGFGAGIVTKIGHDVSHLVVNSLRPRTKKVQQAARIPSIRIVNQDWLAACFSQWRIVEEGPYLFDVHPDDRPAEGDATISDADETDDAVKDSDKPPSTPVRGGQILRIKAPAPRLKLVSASGETKELDDEDSDDEDDDDGDMEDVEDEDVLPDDINDGQLSPIDGLKTFNWGQVDDELQEFLASGSDDDDDDDDGDEDADTMDTDADETSPSSRKRKFEGGESEDAGDGTDAETAQDENTALSNGIGTRDGASVAKKLRRTKSLRGTSSLRNQYVSDVDGDADGDSSLLTPQVTGDEEEVSLIKGGLTPSLVEAEASATEADLDATDLEAEFEAELMAEFEAAAGGEANGNDGEKG